MLHKETYRLEALLDAENVRCRATSSSRKRVLQLVAELVADDQIDADVLFDGLMTRERLGSTGLGYGVAIPHCRISCDQMRAAFVSLAEPIDYEASDGEPVDLLFVLVVPEEEQHAHLDALAALADIFSDPDNRAALRACVQGDELRQAISQRLALRVPNTKSA